ncbi:MAG: hypothetical protein ACXWC4_00670 [Telluria sp.]
MRFNIPNRGIALPKVTDEWPHKLAVFATMLAVVYFLPSDYRVAVLAILAAVVYINDVELRVRASMINVMDYQLVEQSRTINELQAELLDMRDRLGMIESKLD